MITTTQDRVGVEQIKSCIWMFWSTETPDFHLLRRCTLTDPRVLITTHFHLTVTVAEFKTSSGSWPIPLPTVSPEWRPIEAVEQPSFAAQPAES